MRVDDDVNVEVPDVFLRTMGIGSLEQLPKLPDISESEGMEKLQSAIEKLQNSGDGEQLSLVDINTDEE